MTWKDNHYIDEQVPSSVWHRLFNKWVDDNKVHEVFVFR
jgi:hypothetical protein